ncbi:MAG: hypothetical protein HFE45_00155 [Oscillospiraceae bacterium]|nr:hypothetical protein [Oscillospiraceae bacterium]
MKLTEIDQNFQLKTAITEPDIVWLDIKKTPFAISGIFYEEGRGFLRMPQQTAEQVSEGVAGLNADTAGGRVRFRTDSPFIAIEAQMAVQDLMPHFTRLGQSGFDLYRKTEGQPCYLASFMPPTLMKEGYSASVAADGELAEYTVNFPLYDRVSELYIALKRDAVLEAPAPYRNEKPVVFYGSSITQGGCASRPGNSYPAILSRRLHMEYVNLGFSGSGKAEPAMRRYLAQLPMAAFVCDYDHNAPDADYLQKTHLPLYRAVREAQPLLPIIFMTSTDVLLRGGVWRERREIIRRTYETALAEGDQNVYFIDGEALFAGEGWDGCTVDGCHPNDLGFYRMAMGLEGTLEKVLGCRE